MYMEEGFKQIFKIKFSLKQSPEVDHWLIKPCPNLGDCCATNCIWALETAYQ